jgi:Putative transposase
VPVPDAPLRAAVTALAPEPPSAAADPTDAAADRPWRSPARYLGAMLLARLYETFPLACPSCTSRRMVETAAHLVDHVLPRLPVRQWVLSVPKRLRYFLRHDRRVVTAVLAILLRQVERVLRECAPGCAPGARLGAMSFLHRFGSALNEHIHFHCAIIEGVFEARPDGEPAVQFREVTLTEADIQRIQTRVRQRILRWLTAQGCIDPDDAKDMAQWGGGHRPGPADPAPRADPHAQPQPRRALGARRPAASGPCF